MSTDNEMDVWKKQLMSINGEYKLPPYNTYSFFSENVEPVVYTVCKLIKSLGGQPLVSCHGHYETAPYVMFIIGTHRYKDIESVFNNVETVHLEHYDVKWMITETNCFTLDKENFFKVCIRLAPNIYRKDKEAAFWLCETFQGPGKDGAILDLEKKLLDQTYEKVNANLMLSAMNYFKDKDYRE